MTEQRDWRAEAEQTLVDHVPDDRGWCKACGERSPCTYVKDASSLLIEDGRLKPPPNAFGSAPRAGEPKPEAETSEAPPVKPAQLDLPRYRIARRRSL